jgi:O-antigen/teichoic acid export membrane protein
MMSLLRRIRHQATRRQLVREGFYCYIVAFVFIFLDLHFFGIKHYYPSFHREYLPVDAAAIRAILWGLIGLVLWAVQEYVLQGNDLWTSFWGLDLQIQRLIAGGAIVIVLATVVAWRLMLPLWGLAAAVVLYLRFSRPKDSLQF